MGESVQILSKNEEGKLVLNRDALSRVLLHPNAERKQISILSVAGAFRLGKSFLLNFFLRYLKNAGYQNCQWLGEKEKKLDDGFAWRGGAQRHTTGINIWTEPFIVENNGQQIAVFLLDTQGSHDLTAGKEECVKIFAISLLLSSVMVFNISGQIQEDDLDYLQFCAEYCKAATDGGAQRSLFQKLLFLVRDWSSLNDYEYGIEEGNKYLSDTILNIDSGSKNTTLQRTRGHLSRSFNKIECYLMPHPGKNVQITKKQQRFEGCIKDIDDEFLTHVSQLATHLLNPFNLVVKDSYTARGLLSFIVHFCNDLKSNKDGKLPLPTTILESTAEAHTVDAFLESLSQYNEKMDRMLSKGFTSWETFERTEREASECALSKLTGSTAFGGTERKENTTKRLQGLLIEAHKRAEARNRMLEKLKMESLEELIAGYVTDYKVDMMKINETCDPNEVSSLLLREHRKLKESLSKSFQRDAREIFGINSDVKMKKFNDEIEDAFILVELQTENLMGRLEFKLLKLVCDSVDIYDAEYSDEDETRCREVALKHFGENQPEGAPISMLKRGRGKLKRLLQKGSIGREKEILVAKIEISLFYCKDCCSEKVYNIITTTGDFCCDEDTLHERLDVAKNIVLGEFAAEESKHDLPADGRRHKLNGELERYIEKAFAYVKRRNKRYIDRLKAILEVDSLKAEIEYSKTLEKELNGYYMLPADLDNVHSRVLNRVLPRQVPGVAEIMLRRHNQVLSINLKSIFERFQKWNDENKGLFMEITSKLSGGIMQLGQKVAGGVSATIAGAEGAGISTAVLLPIAGGALLGGITVLSVGAAVCYTNRVKGMMSHFKNETKHMEHRLDAMSTEKDAVKRVVPRK